MKLSCRLTAIYNLVPENSRVADIGADHAYLACYLKKTGKATSVIASELAIGPFNSMKRTVGEYGLENEVTLRMGDGLSTIQAGEVDVIVIAGMGGSTIVHILSTGEHLLSSIEYLILQPQGSELPLLAWLKDHGLCVCEEDLVHEDNRYYRIMKVGRGDLVEEDEVLLELGPCLYRDKHPLLAGYGRELLVTWGRIAEGLEKSPAAYNKLSLLRVKMARLEEMLLCL